jgi:hypothetical protein
MMKNLSKATGFDCDTHDRIFVNAFLTKGWQTTLKGYKVSRGVLFHHI